MSNTKKLFSQIIKFGFVGGTAFVIDAGLLFLLTEFCGIHYLISGMISFTASVIYNYILSVKWVFDAKKDANKTQMCIRDSLYVSHSIESIKSLCDKVVWLEHGKVIQVGTAEKVCAAYYESQIGK